jgi:16S rRNA (guanine966-N2)-methyltransferase
VKESLFNIIAGCVEGAEVLDLYAGTGSLGIEALSRGAKRAVFVDKSSEAIKVIKDNLNHTKLLNNSEVITGDVLKAINRLCREGRSFDIIFMDPPYRKNYLKDTLQIVSDSGIIKDNGIAVAEREADDEAVEVLGRLKLWKNARYGNTVLSFYSQLPQT